MSPSDSPMVSVVTSPHDTPDPMLRSPLVRLREAGIFPLVIFLLALGLRLLFLQGYLPVLESRQAPTYGDAAGYYLSAVSLLGGDPANVREVALDSWDNAAWSIERSWQMMQSRGPGYILFLTGLFSVFGHDPWPVRYAQALLGAVACVCIGLVTTRLAGARAGWIAALLAAWYPSYILFTGRILTETLATALLWLGVLAHLEGIQRRTVLGLFAAGLLYACAALTRPTLLATIPFLLLATFLAIPKRPWRVALPLNLAFAAALLGPVVAWNSLARNHGGVLVVAGEQGASFFLSMVKAAATPAQLGWSTDVHMGFDWRGYLDQHPFYPLPAIANLVFFHLWFLDNLWREIPMWLHAFQRAAVVLALGGLGLSLANWRRFAPLLALWATLTAVSVKWIEIRPNLPLMAVLFVFAGLQVSFLMGPSLREHWRPKVVGVSLCATGAVAVCSPLQDFGAPFSFLDPLTLGGVRDGLVIAIAASFFALNYRLRPPCLSRRVAWFSSGASVLLFALLYWSYAHVGSAPRWRAWELPLETAQPICQEISLIEPISRQSARTAYWLVDLQTDLDTPPVRVGMNGAWLDRKQYAWRRPFCDQTDSLPESKNACEIYMELDSFTHAFRASPQWWLLEVNPRLVEGRDGVTLALELDADAATPAEHTVSLGGTYHGVVEMAYYGPAINAMTLGSRTSLYRWHVVNDWRMWYTKRLQSLATSSRIPGGQDTSWPGLYLQRMTDGGNAHFNIRLRVEFADGSQLTL